MQTRKKIQGPFLSIPFGKAISGGLAAIFLPISPSLDYRNSNSILTLPTISLSSSLLHCTIAQPRHVRQVHDRAHLHRSTFAMPTSHLQLHARARAQPAT